MAWLVRERATGNEWRVDTSDLAWEVGGYDITRFELHVLDEAIDDASNVPRAASAGRSAAGSR